jgi:uncharacterized protein YbjQ (UPF0145 family)
MNDKLQQVYDLYKSKGIIKSTDFNTFATADDSQRKKLYDLGVSGGLFKSTDYDTFSTAWGGESKTQTPEKEVVKKKVLTESDSKLEKPSLVSSTKEVEDGGLKVMPGGGTLRTPEKMQYRGDYKPTEKKISGGGEVLESNDGAKYRYQNGKYYTFTDTSIDKKTGAKVNNYNTQINNSQRIKTLDKMFNKADYYKGYPGKEDKEYRLKYGIWQEEDPKTKSFKPITDPTRVSTLNSYFKQEADTDPYGKTFVGYPGKESNEYRISETGAWQRKQKGQREFQTITDDTAIKALNKQFKQNVGTFNEEDKARIEAESKDRYKMLETINGITSDFIAAVGNDVVGEGIVSSLEQSYPGFKFDRKKGILTSELEIISPSNTRITVTLEKNPQEAQRLREWLREESKKDVTKAQKDLSRSEYELDMAQRQQNQQSQFESQPNLKPVVSTVTDATGQNINVTMNAPQTEVARLEAEKKEATKKYVANKSQQLRDTYSEHKDNLNSPEAKAAFSAIKSDNKDIEIKNNYVNDIKDSYTQYGKKTAQFDAYVSDVQAKLKSGEITQEQYDSLYKPNIDKMSSELDIENKSLSKEVSNLSNLSRGVDKSIAENFILDEAKGGFLNTMAFKAIRGTTYLPRLLSMGEITPEDQDAFARFFTGDVSTQAYMESEKRSDVATALFSVAESLGALASSAPLSAAGIATGMFNPAFYAMGYYESKDELDKVEGMSEVERVLMSSVYGGVSSVLETFGIEMALQKTPFGKNLTNNIMKGVFSSLPKNAPKEFIDAAITNSVTKTLTALGIEGGIAAGAEGLTEAAQSLSQAGINEVYDAAKGTDYFNNKGAWDVFSNALYEGYLGALGGGIMNVAHSAPQIASNGANAVLNKDQIALLIQSAKTDGMDEALLTNLKAEIISGKISKDEAITINNSFREVKGKIESMPETMNTEQKSVALDLMLEKDKIEKQIEGKDPNLVEPQKKRVNEINDRLKQIGEDAVQKQTTGEVPVQSETGVSEEVEGGVSQPTTEQAATEVVGEEVVGEEVKGEQAQAEVTKQEEVVLNSMNPSGGIFVEYTPEQRDALPLGENITTYDETADISPTEKVTVYRGVPNDVNEIKSGDFVTTNEQLAKDYAGEGKVISMEVNANDILDDKTEPLGEEYILRIKQPVSETTTTETTTEEVDSELNDFESLLSDEGIAPVTTKEEAKQPVNEPSVETEQLPVAEEAVVEEKPAKRPRTKKGATVPAIEETTTAAETVTAPEETVVDTSEVSDRDIMDIEDSNENIRTEQDNIKQYQAEAKAKIDKINKSKWSPVRKKNEAAKVRQEYKDKIEAARLTIATNKSDAKKAETRVKKATKTTTAPVTTPVAETAPVEEAPATAPTRKPKAPKKLTKKETLQKYNDHIDSLIRDEKEKSDRRIAQLANQRNSATGQRRTELTQEIQDLEFAFKAKKRGLESKKDDVQAAVEFVANAPRFRMSEGAQEEADTRNDEQAIVDKMNEASAEEKGLTRGEVPESVEVDPIEESSSLSKALDKVLKFLGLKDKSELLKPIEYFNGIPMILGMSDILAAGTIKDSMGNEMKVGGGKLYNLLGENQELAWAGVTQPGSDNQVDQALNIYKANKELFDRLWAEGKIPYGHIPMAIMRMGNTAINSNEAVFRYLLPLVKSLPLKNRIAALKTYMQALQSKAEGNAASYWFTELEEQIETGNLTTKEQVIDYLNKLAEKEQKAHEESKKEGKNAKVTKINAFKNAILKKKDGTFDDVREELTKRLDKIVPFMLMNYIQENKIKTLDGFLEAVVNESKKRAEGQNNIFSLPVRSFIFNSLISPESTKKENNLKVIKTLLDGVKNADATIFTAKHIYNAIGEKSMLRTNKGDVVAIVGIKIFDENGNPAGGTKKAEHNNYGFGPEGRMIALIKNPKPGIDVFPEFRAKLARVFKPSTTGKYPTIEDAVNQTGGAFFMDSAFRGAAPAVDAMTDLKILIGKLRFAFPEVSVSTTQEEFDNFLEQEGVRAREKDGKVIYGVTKDGRIFLNPSEQTLRTPIHEFGHIWIDYLRSKESGKKGDMLLQKGFELVDGTAEYERALKEYGNRELALEEALVELMAVKGDTIASAAKRSEFLEWMNAMFKYIKENLTRSKDFAQSRIKDLTLDEFINIGLADLFSGEKVSGKFDARTAGGASRARFSLNSNQDMINIIDLGRQNGYSNDTIKKSLLNRGYKAADINAALEVNVDALTILPNEFGNVEGGVVEGKKLFEEIKDDLSAWQSTITNETEKSLSETRKKAIELLKSNPIFKKQSEQIQNELIVALDKSMGIRANKTIQREISEIKKSLRQRKIGAKNLKDAQQALKAFIRKNLPSSSAYAKSQIEKLISAVNETTPTNFTAQAETVLGVVEQHREKMKQALLKSIRTLVTKKAQAAITPSGKRRSGGLDAEGQAFFQAAKPIIKAAIENDIDAMLDIMNELSDTAMIDEVVAKEVAGEKLTSKEEALLNKALAFDTFADIQSMELEEVQKLFDALKDVRTESIKRLKSRRIQKAEENKRTIEQLTEQIKNAYGDVLFKKDGSVKDKNDFDQDQAAIWNSFKEMKILSGIKAWAKRYDFNTVLGIKDLFVNRIAHIGSLATILDKGGSFIYDNTYVQLNRMDEADKRGYQNEMERLDSIANSIDGVTKGYKQVRNSIPNGTFKIKLKGVEKIFNADQLWRIYSLSKNDVQRAKLENMGFDSDKIEEIKSIIGEQAVEFSDKLIDYLSNEYYESINNVYSYVNDVNLGYVNNYFPTMTIATKVDAKMLQDGNFNGVFNAETAPAFKERVDQKSDVDLGADFTSVVESHFRAMEKYKAYAEGVKKMNSLFNAPSFNALLEQTRTKNAMKLAINLAINPNAGLKQEQIFVGKAFSKFSGYALAFKVAQIPKQATSFVNAYEDYQFRKGKNTPGLDAIMYMLDTAHTILTLPVQVKKAYDVSANFRDRIKKGVEGDVYGLEAGSRIFKPLSKSNTLFGKVKRFLKSTAAAPTMIGDVLGVMGYMTNYNRNIKNGMSKAEALEAFNNYNATLQSRRAADKAPLQQSQNELVRAFTMFGSTAFLQMNKVAIGYTKIMRDLSNYPTTKKLPSATDLRAVALNLGIANALFVLTAYIAKYVVGDEDEEEEVMNEIYNALEGLNLLYQLPLIGGAAEEIVNYSEGKRAFTSEIVNPYSSVFRKVKKGFEVEGSNIYDKTRPIVELALGAQADPFIGLYNLYQKDEMDPNDLYDVLGVAKTYRPADTEGKNPAEIIKNKITAAKTKLSKEIKKLKTSIRSNGITKEEYKKSMEEARSEYEERINDLRDRLDKIK